MNSPSFADWVAMAAAITTAIATIAAIVAAFYSAKAAKASADQVELQRPRPIVLVTFSRSFKENQTTGEERFDEFHLQNIGDSPAFDVEVGSLALPDETNRLITETLSHLVAGAPYPCKHRLEVNKSPLTMPAVRFAADLYHYFDTYSSGSLSERIDTKHQIEFTLSYRALDKRRFEQRYAFIVYFPKQRVWLEPIGSLLEAP